MRRTRESERVRSSERVRERERQRKRERRQEQKEECPSQEEESCGSGARGRTPPTTRRLRLCRTRGTQYNFQEDLAALSPSSADWSDNTRYPPLECHPGAASTPKRNGNRGSTKLGVVRGKNGVRETEKEGEKEKERRVEGDENKKIHSERAESRIAGCSLTAPSRSTPSRDCCSAYHRSSRNSQSSRKHPYCDLVESNGSAKAEETSRRDRNGWCC